MAVSFLVVALAGCSTAPAPTPTPTSSQADPNAASCKDFEQATDRTVYLAASAWSETRELTEAEDAELKSMGAEIDSIGLSASGEAAARIGEVADYLIDLGTPALILLEQEEWDRLLQAVERACEVAGTPIEAFELGDVG